MSVEPPRNFSGIAKGSGKPYSMNRRKFQIYANKQLFQCQDSRDDEKQGDRVLALGIDRFSVLEEEEIRSFVVRDVEVGKGPSYDLTYNLITD